MFAFRGGEGGEQHHVFIFRCLRVDLRFSGTLQWECAERPPENVENEIGERKEAQKRRLFLRLFSLSAAFPNRAFFSTNEHELERGGGEETRMLPRSECCIPCGRSPAGVKEGESGSELVAGEMKTH